MIAETLEKIAATPGMFVSRPSLDSAISLVVGCNCGSNFALVIGLKEWLVVRLGRGESIAWPQLIEDAIIADHSGSTPEEQFCAALRLVAGFLRERAVHRGDRAIFQRYAEWEKLYKSKQK